MIKDRSIKKWIQLLVAVLFICIPVALTAQEETVATPATPEPEKKESKPVRSPFQASTLIESQTYVVFSKGTLVFDMQHRMGPLNLNAINRDDFVLGGIYGPSNIRMGLTYVVIDNLQIGLGTTKNQKLQDLNWKYSILTQTRSNSMPIALTYYGNFVYDASKKSNFEDEYTEYKEIHRISYFHQLIIGRKFTKDLTVQLMLNYAHFNLIDTVQRNTEEPPYANEAKHDNFGIGIGGRYKFSPQGSAIFEYEHSLTTPENIKPNLSLGVEWATSSHAFQIFITTYSNLVYQHNLVYNTNDFTDKGLRLGFNITRNWNF